MQSVCYTQKKVYKQYLYIHRLTCNDSKPGQCDISEVSVEGNRLGTPRFLPEVECLCEAFGCPQGIIGSIIQLWQQQVYSIISSIYNSQHYGCP